MSLFLVYLSYICLPSRCFSPLSVFFFSFLCIWGRGTCSCGCVLECVEAEVDTRCLPLSLSALFLRQDLSLNVEVTDRLD